MTLSEKQQIFWELLTLKLAPWIKERGYKVTFGESYRPPEMAAIYAEEGRGIKNSLHSLRLAIDLNIFHDGQFLTELDAYRPIGEYWKSLITDGITPCWGGDFEKPDADHFSLLHEGIR